MLGILPVTRNGTSLVFISGILLLPVLVSLISIIAKLIFFKKRKYYLLRPGLTIAIFILMIFIAKWTYQAALEQAEQAAMEIHRHCNEQQSCPAIPAGWQKNGNSVRKTDLGPWLKYIAIYHADGDRFSIRLYQGPDLGDVISGGANLPFSVLPYQEPR